MRKQKVTSESYVEKYYNYQRLHSQPTICRRFCTKRVLYEIPFAGVHNYLTTTVPPRTVANSVQEISQDKPRENLDSSNPA